MPGAKYFKHFSMVSVTVKKLSKLGIFAEYQFLSGPQNIYSPSWDSPKLNDQNACAWKSFQLVDILISQKKFIC